MRFLRSIAVVLSIIILHAAGFAITEGPGVQYLGYKVVRIPTGPSVEAMGKLRALVDSLDLELWTTVPRLDSHMDVMIPPDLFETFMTSAERITKEAGISLPLTIMHEDLGKSIWEESKVPEEFYQLRKRDGLAIPAWFNSYHPYDDHLGFLNDLVTAYPNNAKIITFGKTVQNRSITGINIFGSSGSGTKPAIIWHGNVHAREWITSMVVEYFAYQLLTNYGNSTTIHDYVENYDFNIFPHVNPDGFIYSQTNDRLWRKNRQSPPSNSTCYGRDLNRNWDTHWSDSGGASDRPCAQDYKGQAAADTPEIQALANFQNAKSSTSPGVKMYVDWHSYSQMFFTPYGYTCSGKPADYTELFDLAKGFVQKLQEPYGTEFDYGPSCNTIYKTTGSSCDYSYDVSKIKYSFAAELRDTGTDGFILPTNQILPSGIETWAGLRYIMDRMK